MAAEGIYNRGKYLVTNGGLAALDLRMLIVTGTATGVDAPTLNTVADLDAVTGVSIHTERIALTSEAVTEDDDNSRVNVDSANVTYAAAAGVTARGAVVYDEGNGTDAGRQLISWHTTGFPQPMDGGLTVGIADWLRAA